MPRTLCKPYLFFRLTLNLMPPALPAWYAMSLLPSCVSLYTLSNSPSTNKSQQKVSPTLSCALRLLVTSNILLPKHRNVQLRSGSQRTITSSPTCNSLDKHALLKNISLCDAIVCPPLQKYPPVAKICKIVKSQEFSDHVQRIFAGFAFLVVNMPPHAFECGSTDIFVAFGKQQFAQIRKVVVAFHFKPSPFL